MNMSKKVMVCILKKLVLSKIMSGMWNLVLRSYQWVFPSSRKIAHQVRDRENHFVSIENIVKWY